MFKYTPPWQVLCAALEPRVQGQESVLHADSLLAFEEPKINPTAEEQLRVQENIPEELKEESPPEMDRVTRHLIFHIPHTSPKHSPHHDSWSAELSSQDAPSSHGNQKDTNGHDWRPSSPPEARSELASPLEAGRDLWTPPPDRESKLGLVKSGMLYNIRTYKEERKPSKLYSDDEEEPSSPHSRVAISPEKARELEEERKAVIQSQVVRRCSTGAEKQSSVDEPDSLSTGSAGRHKATPGGGYVTSFALCFNSPSPAHARTTPVDPENVDREQINFAAARQQFLLLEKTNPTSLFSPRQRVMSPKPESTQHISEGAGKVFMHYEDVPSQREINGYDVEYKTPRMEELHAPKKAGMEREEPDGRTASLTKTSSRDDLDSGLGEMSNEFSAGYVSDGSMSNEVFLDASSQDPGKETPIEREIRLAMEREESLRKERGIQRLTSSNELVEIQTKPLLSTSLSSSSSRKVKDKGRVSFYVQREIEQEIKREEDLKKEGRLLGTYDKGMQQELGERKKVFEQEDAAAAPQKPTFAKKSEALTGTSNSKFAMAGSFGPRDSQRSTADEWPSASCSKLVEVDSSRARQASSPERADSTACPEERVGLPEEYFTTRFWKPKVSFVSEEGVPGPLGKEKVLEPAGPQADQYTLKKCKPQTSWLIEEEIRSDMQREQELQEQRRGRLLTDDSSALEKGFWSQRSSQSSVASGIADSYEVTQSPVFVPASHQAGVARAASPPSVPSPYWGYTGRLASESAHDGPTRARRDEKPRKLKDDKRYASIEAIDDVNAETASSTGEHQIRIQPPAETPLLSLGLWTASGSPYPYWNPTRDFRKHPSDPPQECYGRTLGVGTVLQ
ncbi:mitotic interactor and substrate of PLK1 isoform X1 [Pelodiscus sinensis]|uniref:mitotic interactor and substrate of PLK1 isoform X1 n=2 Tax=Pelodiscus sinensis TaxID=13735 RepID=UPI003F6D8D7C